ncbi:ROK family protein [Curtobacterium sp. 9128]|uniref:ROK family protein n=1 Tax=Curtobacterium sp. 9128 TaxID=1793722 RepID=UPI0011A03D0E|nr:ROK family protein [Curtobacterium sp. 9128]
MAGVGAVLGVDVGGTGIKARLTDLDGRVLAEHRVPTPRDDHDAVALAATIATIATTVTAPGSPSLDAIGVVVPGVVDERAGTVALAVNLGWRDVPVRARIVEALRTQGVDVPLTFGHDVRAGALAEVRGRGVDGPGSPDALSGSVAFVPVGTGLASALVVDGVVVDGNGWAGEIGQVRIQHGPHAGARVEEVASASAVARRTAAPSALAAVLRVQQGDPDAVRVWRECVETLADAIGWITAVAGCHTVVVGGGLAESGPLLLDPLRTAVADRLVGLGQPRIVRARHGDAAGAIGAGLLARDVLVGLDDRAVLR